MRTVGKFILKQGDSESLTLTDSIDSTGVASSEPLRIKQTHRIGGRSPSPDRAVTIAP